jgi:glycosyltransferase involved in cell wall biosynthesis
LRVLLASHRYYPVPGGTERIVQTIAQGLVARGHEVGVVTQLEPDVPAREEIGGVVVRRIPVRPLLGIRWPRGYLRTLRDWPADMFHLHGNRIWCADFYFPSAGRFRWPQILTGHGFYQYAVRRGRVDRWYFERYFPRAVAKFGAYAALTEFEAGQLTRWGVAPEKIAQVPNGINLSEFSHTSAPSPSLRERWAMRAENVAVYAGGFYENKRVDRLVDAIAQTRSSWALVAIGPDIPNSPYSLSVVARLARERGVEANSPGVLPRAETVQAIRGADAVVLGSSYEGFGVLLLESMAAGRPFVSWAVGAAPELAQKGAGIAVSSTEELARALDRLAQADRRDSMGRAGRALAPDYSEDRMVERYLELYQRVLAHP